MAHKIAVSGRSYPFLYNVTMTVGSRKSLLRSGPPSPTFAAPYIPAFPEPAYPGWTPDPEPTVTTKYCASYEPNKRDDVMLVQYLLKRIYQKGHLCNPPLRTNSIAHLKIDGIYGSGTQSAIEHFQLEMRRNGRKIATDGCVNPENNGGSTSTISKTGYTISWLNKYFWLLYPTLAPDITADPECPPELKLAVS